MSLINFNEINWIKSLSMVNTISFLGLSLEEFSTSLSKVHNYTTNDREIMRYSSLLLGVAGIHYSIISVSDLSKETELYVRYSDWLITTPLLLVVVGKYYDLDDSLIGTLVIYNILMILSGLIYEITGNINYWIAGTIFYLLLIYILFRNVKEDDGLFKNYFVYGWSLYGLVSLIDIEKRFFIYNFLDFYNKFVFGYHVRYMITERSKISIE
jgi:bacteriorhodopsin